MKHFERINEHICRLTTPYKDIFTTVYTVEAPTGTIVFDAASYAADAHEHILPMLAEAGTAPERVKFIFISHKHADHAGGLEALSNLCSGACIVSRSPELKETYRLTRPFYAPQDGDRFFDWFQVIAIPGHTADSMALLDRRTNTLITGDCLQSYGIYGSGTWYGAVVFPAEHFAALRRLRALPLETVATAHDYHPVGLISHGRDEINARLDSCVGALDRLRGMMEANPILDDEQVAELANDGRLPKVAPRVVAALRDAVAAGKI
jgi:glyoxylase-like metal-dependent hydrolase (beta-lactamase superfamily II)